MRRDPRRRPAARGDAAHRRHRALAPRATPALAKQYYVKALELRGDDRRALVALESLYEETGGPRGAPRHRQASRRGAPRATQERKQLLFKQARLCDEKLGDAAGAIGVYEQILELALDAEAIAALERLYARRRALGRPRRPLRAADCGAPGASNERKAALHHALGSVLEQRMHEVERAFDEYAAALAIDPKHPQTVASLEALMDEREHAARAAEMLEPVYLARLDWRRVMTTLEARLDVEPGPRRAPAAAARVWPRCTRSRKRTTRPPSRRRRSCSPRT